MNKPPHGNTGNRNALKFDEPATSHLHIRIPQSLKAQYVKAAQREGMKLAEWVLRNCNEKL